ncbi:MAG: hypothetical protein HC807_05550 [Gammaproteobacteria bacterium]|nr:hypothetical protein [Gammaproteobacteria bacterium]
MKTPSLGEMLHRLIRAEGQGQAARTVELFGWLILAEGAVLLLVPQVAVTLLHLPPLEGQAENYFRLVGLLVSGLGMLYVASGRLNAQGFVFASLLDRPLVPPVMLVLWFLGILPWPLALAFSVQDFASFLWTLRAWRAEHGSGA